MNYSNPKQALLILGFSLLLGLSFNYLFFQTWVGMNVPIFALLLLVAYLAILKAGGAKIQREVLMLMVPVVFLSLMTAVRANPFLLFLNCATTIFLLVLIVDSSKREGRRKSILDYIIPFVLSPFIYLGNASKALREATATKKEQQQNKKLGAIFKGILMAIPVLVVFGLLFASADLVVEEYLDEIFDFSISAETVSQLLIIVLTSILVAGALRYATEQNRKQMSWALLPVKRSVGKVEISVFLGLINALFLFFIVIQLRYLFGGAENISELGFTYAEYARKGFGELIFIALLTYLLILVSEKSVKKEKETHTIHFKTLSALLVVQTLGVLGSSFYRLFLYEQAFGFTLPRFYAHVFLIWLGLIFLVFLYLLFVQKHKHHFLKIAFCSAIVFLIGINLTNPDVFVAKHNIKRLAYPEREGLDVYYLSGLSDDALNVTIGLLEDGSPLDDDARNNLAWLMYSNSQSRDNKYSTKWQSSNLSRIRADEILWAEQERIKTGYNAYQKRMDKEFSVRVEPFAPHDFRRIE